MQTKILSQIKSVLQISCYGVISILMGTAGFADYPASTAITGVTFDYNKALRYAIGGDIWPVTWASDDLVYTSWGDGGGFAGNLKAARASLGVSSIKGMYPNLVGHDIWGGDTADYKATFKGKASGMLAIGNRLYMWVNFRRANDGGDPGHAILAWSDNKGASWTKASWDWDTSYIADPTFVNFGKAYANARDNYVYCYASDTYHGNVDKRSIPRDHIFLFRVPKDKLTTRSAYEFYTGMGASGPNWSSKISDMKPVFTNKGKVTWSLSVTWFPGMNRYILFNNNSPTIGPSNIAIYDAPEPWGPWTKVVEYKEWVGNRNYVFSLYPIPKMISADGKDFVLAFSGTKAYDSLNIIQGHFKLASSAPMKPVAPGGLTAKASSSSQINLSWTDNSKNESGYKIERKKGTNGTFVQIASLAADLNTYSDAGLASGTTYFYRVRAYNDAGNSAYSNTADATLSSAPTVPAAPSGLTAATQSTTAIKLSWMDHSNNETSFRILRREGSSGLYSFLVAVGANVTSVTDSGLKPGTVYYYKVRANNPAGLSAYSNSANATTMAAPTVPVAPGGVTAIAQTSSAIKVSWVDHSNDETSFRILRREGATGVYAYLKSVAANVTTFTDTGLKAKTLYYYKVRANNAQGLSPYSNAASATTLSAVPAAPSELAATALSSTEIKLTWIDHSTDETGFKIERRKASETTFTQIATVGVNVKTFKNSGLTPNTRYYYRIRAKNGAGNSPYSNQADVKTLSDASLVAADETPMGVPSNVEAQVSSSGVLLNWTDHSSDEDNFRLRRKVGEQGEWIYQGLIKNLTTYRDTDIHSGQTYYYKVRAAKGMDPDTIYSDWSEVASATIP